MEEKHLEHKPIFFDAWENPYDNQTYYIYNNKYFEHCRKNQDWKECPDIFSNDLPTKD